MMQRAAIFSLVTLLINGYAAAGSAETDLEQGIALYWSGEYAETIEVLTVAHQSILRTDEKVECLKYLAFSHVAVGDNEKARDVFAELIASDPGLVLDQSLVSPKIVHQFELSRTQFVESLLQQGKASYFEKDYAATRQNMNRILSLDPRHALAKEYLQLASEREELIEEAAALKQTNQPPPKEVAQPEPKNRVYHLTGQITPPVLISSVNPEYPLSARRRGKEGASVIALTIGVDGSVTEAKIIRFVSPEIDKAALVAVRQWRYRPARMDGRAVAVYRVVKLEFLFDR